MIGAQTYLSVNVASSNPTEMREWIEYLTSDNQDDFAKERRANGRNQPFKLDYVGIGNESWGCGGAMRPEYYADVYRRFAAFFHGRNGAFHNNNDNGALRVASGANNFETEWTDVVTKNAGSMMDAISLHYYTLNKGIWPTRNTLTALDIDSDAWYEIVYQAMRMEDVLQAHEKVLDSNDPDGRIALYVDEWGTWYRPELGHEPSFLYQQNTLRDAITAAITLDIFHRHTRRVKMANIAQTVNVLQAMLLTDGDKMAKTPTYYVFKMYRDFQGAIPVDLSFTSPKIVHQENEFAAISSSAAINEQGQLLISLTNADINLSHDLSIALDKPYTIKNAEIVTHEELNAHNIPGQKDVVMSELFTGAVVDGDKLNVVLPAKSVIVLTLH
jgi:alpha-N-arabinofuranosidase